MKPKCILNLKICCLDCTHSVAHREYDEVECNVEGCKYCGFRWYRDNDSINKII